MNFVDSKHLELKGKCFIGHIEQSSIECSTVFRSTRNTKFGALTVGVPYYFRLVLSGCKAVFGKNTWYVNEILLKF